MRQSWSNNCGMAVISLGLATWPSAIPSSLAQQCAGSGLCHDRASPPNYLFMLCCPGVATDAKSNEITAICLTDTLIKCGGHDESVDVVGIHLIRFGRVQNQYRPPGLCVVFRDGQRHAPITRGLKQLGFDDYFTPPEMPPQKCPSQKCPSQKCPPGNAPPDKPSPGKPLSGDTRKPRPFCCIGAVAS